MSLAVWAFLAAIACLSTWAGFGPAVLGLGWPRRRNQQGTQLIHARCGVAPVLVRGADGIASSISRSMRCCACSGLQPVGRPRVDQLHATPGGHLGGQLSVQGLRIVGALLTRILQHGLGLGELNLIFLLRSFIVRPSRDAIFC